MQLGLHPALRAWGSLQHHIETFIDLQWRLGKRSRNLKIMKRWRIWTEWLSRHAVHSASFGWGISFCRWSVSGIGIWARAAWSTLVLYNNQTNWRTTVKNHSTGFSFEVGKKVRLTYDFISSDIKIACLMNDSRWECRNWLCIRERVLNDVSKVGNVRNRRTGEEEEREREGGWGEGETRGPRGAS